MYISHPIHYHIPSHVAAVMENKMHQAKPPGSRHCSGEALEIFLVGEEEVQQCLRVTSNFR